jgi:hypothetical protein
MAARGYVADKQPLLNEEESRLSEQGKGTRHKNSAPSESLRILATNRIDLVKLQMEFWWIDVVQNWSRFTLVYNRILREEV